MRSELLVWTGAGGWKGREPRHATDLVLFFGNRMLLADGERYGELRSRFPNACILGCSTGGQICGEEVDDDKIIAAAVHFDSTSLRLVCQDIGDAAQSHRCGQAIGQHLRGQDLAGVFILSDGLHVNGSELVAGMTSVLGSEIPLTGGLAGDGADFQETLVSGDCPPRSRVVAAVGFYGSSIRLGHGSAGGWDVFGPKRRVTRSIGNVLYELDGQRALDLYERYLGPEESKGLPGTALLFPLQISDPERPDHQVVRTVLAVDREARTMTFAGDVPSGWVAQLMRGNFDRLAAGAADAARQANEGVDGHDGLAVLVSCIGRKLLMGQRVADEVEAARVMLGKGLALLGFYSYGEISPHAGSGMCELHNQTMTVTTLCEARV